MFIEYDASGMPMNLPILDKTGKALRIFYLADHDTFGIGQIRIIRSGRMVLVRNLMDGIDYWAKADSLTMIPEDEAIILMLKQKYER